MVWKIDCNTYANKQHRHRGKNSRRKDERDNLRRVLGVAAENVLDLGSLAVAEGSLVGSCSAPGIADNVDIEHGRNNGLGSTERAQNNLGLEGVLGTEELNGKFLLGLFVVHRDIGH